MEIQEKFIRVSKLSCKNIHKLIIQKTIQQTRLIFFILNNRNSSLMFILYLLLKNKIIMKTSEVNYKEIVHGNVINNIRYYYKA